jgi:hypothetical protein
MPKMLWKFRFKDRLVDTAVIETNSADVRVAEAVAQDYLDTHLPRPGVKMLPGSLQPFFDHSEDAMLARQARDKAREVSEAQIGPDVSAAMGGAGSLGAGLDPSSPRGKATRVGA